MILSWIFTDQPPFAWLTRGCDRDIVFDIHDACSEQVAEFLTDSLGVQCRVTVEDIWLQARQLGRFIIDPTATPFAEGVPTEQNPLFNWLMNAAILFFGSRRTGQITRIDPVRQARPLCLDSLRAQLSDHYGYEVGLDDLKAHIIHWLLVFSGYAGGDLPSRSDVAGYTEPKIPVTLAAYLGIPLQPLDPRVAAEVDPQYAGLHQRIVQYYPPRIWNNRLNSLGPFEGTDIVFAANVDWMVHELSEEGVEVREYWPTTAEDRSELPILLFFSGGGWVLGDQSSDEGVLSWICNRAHCRVFNGGYRRRPFPAACDDGVSIMRWVRDFTGSDQIIIGGVSAGGNVAAVAALESARLGFPPIGILLICACLDNTNKCEGRWVGKLESPWLTPKVMRYYQDRYLPNDADRTEENWKASPMFVPSEIIEMVKHIPTRIISMRNDVLHRENMDFANRLEVHGCKITRTVYDLPHMGLSIQGIVGPDMIIECHHFVRSVFEGRDGDDPLN